MISHSDPRYHLWLRVREILLDTLPEWFRATFPAAMKTSEIAERIVESFGQGDPPASQLIRLQRRLARIEHRALALVLYQEGGGRRTELQEELAEELLRRGGPVDCPMCGAPGEEEHKEDCEVLV